MFLTDKKCADWVVDPTKISHGIDPVMQQTKYILAFYNFNEQMLCQK